MYAIIRAGGKQAKVHEGDVLDVERIKRGEGTVSYRPLLLVDDDGSVISDKAVLDGATVTAEVLGDHRGEKIDIFKYKAKTGYRRRQGHRQTYTTIRITAIEVPKAKKKAAKAAATTEAPADEAATETSEEEA